MLITQRYKYNVTKVVHVFNLPFSILAIHMAAFSAPSVADAHLGTCQESALRSWN